MTKQDKIDIMMLLSAIESWSFSVQSRFPDYMHERLTDIVGKLNKEVIDEHNS